MQAALFNKANLAWKKTLSDETALKRIQVIFCLIQRLQSRGVTHTYTCALDQPVKPVHSDWQATGNWEGLSAPLGMTISDKLGSLLQLPPNSYCTTGLPNCWTPVPRFLPVLDPSLPPPRALWWIWPANSSSDRSSLGSQVSLTPLVYSVSPGPYLSFLSQ